MTATLKLTRDQSIPIELRRGPFQISVDDKDVGSLENHETFDVQIAPGHHTLRLHKGRYKSKELGFDVPDGDSVTFRCHGARIWPTWLISFAIPSMAISLGQV
ncbi:MAG: hypothetical protein ACRDXC_05215 [Acidimicrobiales bacterium]